MLFLLSVGDENARRECSGMLQTLNMQLEQMAEFQRIGLYLKREYIETSVILINAIRNLVANKALAVGVKRALVRDLERMCGSLKPLVNLIYLNTKLAWLNLTIDESFLGFVSINFYHLIFLDRGFLI